MHAVKAYGGRRVQFHSFLMEAIFHLYGTRALSPGKVPPVHNGLESGGGGSLSCSGRCGEAESLLTLPGIEYVCIVVIIPVVGTAS
jgi:hypothetical protein